MGRRLGQHFLFDPAILDRIVEAIAPDPGDVVLEIGPGPGTLTRRLAPRVGRVVAIEKDAALAAELAEAAAREPGLANVAVAAGDALTLDWSALAGPAAGLKIIGNVPYYITSPLIERALETPGATVVVFLVQREVADRVAAPPGSKTYGALSVGVQAAARPERLFVVRAGAFRPPPNVDSAVLRLVPRPDPAVSPAERAAFRAFVVGLFAQRRKQVVRGLRVACGLDAAASLAACERAAIAPVARPETLDVSALVRLFRTVPR